MVTKASSTTLLYPIVSYIHGRGHQDDTQGVYHRRCINGSTRPRHKDRQSRCGDCRYKTTDTLELAAHKAKHHPKVRRTTISRTQRDPRSRSGSVSQMAKPISPGRWWPQTQTDTEAPITSLFPEGMELFDNQLATDAGAMTPVRSVTQPQANVKEVSATTTRSSPAPPDYTPPWKEYN